MPRRAEPAARVDAPDPLAVGQAGVRRAAVLAHVATERRRVFAPTVHLGTPGAFLARLAPADAGLDHALRVDALEAMARAVRRRDDATTAPGPLVWLTRSGTLEVQDVDLAWCSAAWAASRELGVPLPMVVVTRQGWHEPRTGASRTWRRLRPPRP